MNPHLATVVYAIGIACLFWLNRDREARTSKALWIPVVWLLINGSRPVSAWLQMAPVMDSPDRYLDGSPVDAAVWAMLLALGIIVLCMRARRVGTLLRANAPILLFLLYCASSVLWSDYPMVAFKRWTKGVGDVVMILIVLTDPHQFTAVRRLLTRVGFVLVPLSLLFIKYYPELGRSYHPWTWVPMFAGVTMGKNLLGMMCMICGLGSLWCFLSAYRGLEGGPRTRQLLAHGVLLGMIIWIFWLINSMTSLSCFVLAGGVIVAMSVPWLARSRAAIHVLAGGVVCISLIALFFDTGGHLVGSLGRDATLTGRTTIWSVVLSLAPRPLLGAGYESFWLGSRLEQVWEGVHEKGIQEAHNGYLEVYLNLGWVGVSLLGILILTGYRNVVAALRREPDTGRLMLAFFLATVIYSLTEAGFRMMALTWITFLLAIVAVPSAAGQTATIESFQTTRVGTDMPPRRLSLGAES